MLDQLRIQCPSCGIVLDVRNSKHEALKQIVCPNCKKQLAVNFEEELEPSAPPQPIEPLYYGEMRIDLKEGVNKVALPDCDYVEIKVVRLKDGNSKCLVKPLSDSHPVKVNGQQLQLEEQVALAKGDILQIGNVCLSHGKPGSIEVVETDLHKDTPKPSKPQSPRNGIKMVWVYSVIACVVLMGATMFLWQKTSAPKLAPDDKQIAQLKDTIKERNITKEIKDSGKEVAIYKGKDKGKGKGRKDLDDGKTKASGSLSILSDFELEKKALAGSVDAQYELGVRLIKRDGINNVVRGIKYLKLAANSGSSKAKTALAKAISILQKKSNAGDSISYYILKAI